RVHAADVGVEEVHGLEALAPHLGVEVDAARRQAALTQDHEHALRRQVQVSRKLIRVPAQKQIAAVGVDGAEQALHRRVSQLMHHGVPGQGRVVRLNVQLEVIDQAVAAQEGNDVGGVEIIL